MRKIYKKLTNDQKARGVIFSSQLIPAGTIHEVYEIDDDKKTQIERLLNDKFFNNSIYKYNEVRN